MANLIAIPCIICAVAALADPPSPAASTAMFATAANAGANVREIIPGATAMVDDHIIPMTDVVLACLHKDRSYVIDRMIQSYVLDRECEKRGITVSEAEIDRRVSQLRDQLAPHPLDEAMALHHTTMAGLPHDFRQEIERMKLVLDQVKPTRLVHARAIFVQANPSGNSQPASGALRSDAQARTLIADIQAQLKAYGGYFLLQAISTSDKHASSQDSAYAQSPATCQNQKAQPLFPQAIVKLIKKSKVVYYVHS